MYMKSPFMYTYIFNVHTMHKEFYNVHKFNFYVHCNTNERRTAMKYLRELERIGILKSLPKGNQILFLNINLYDLLRQDSF